MYGGEDSLTLVGVLYLHLCSCIWYLERPRITPNAPAISSLRMMEHEAWGRPGLSSLDLVRLTFGGPACMKLQGLVGNMMIENFGLEWYLAPLNKELLQSQKLVVVGDSKGAALKRNVAMDSPRGQSGSAYPVAFLGR